MASCYVLVLMYSTKFKTKFHSQVATKTLINHNNIFAVVVSLIFCIDFFNKKKFLSLENQYCMKKVGS